jgi:hypothetical protein
MTLRSTRLVYVLIFLTVLTACGGSGKVNPPVTATSAVTPETTPIEQPGPDVPPAVVGTNGVTVTYTSPTNGKITARAMPGSETQMPGRFGGALFRLSGPSGVSVWGATDGDAYPLLRARPGWTLNKLSGDPTWNPLSCADAPHAIIGDRWLVSAEGSGGLDPENRTNGEASNAYFLRVFDRMNGTFQAVTPITGQEPKRWKGPVWAVSPTEVAIVGHANVRWLNDGIVSTPDTVRIINLETMTFRDEPYREPPTTPNPTTTTEERDGPRTIGVTVRSNASGRTLRLTGVAGVNAHALGGPNVRLSFDNDNPAPGGIASQVGIWNVETGAWDRAIERDTPADPSVVPQREPITATGGSPGGFPVWFATP